MARIGQPNKEGSDALTAFGSANLFSVTVRLRADPRGNRYQYLAKPKSIGNSSVSFLKRHLGFCGDHVGEEFASGIHLQPEQRAQAQKGHHWDERRIVVAEVVHDVAKDLLA